MSTARTTSAFRREVRERAVRVAIDRLNSDGWVNVRMADIAAEVGVSRPTLYAELGKKDDLGRVVVQHEVTRFISGAMATLNAHTDVPREAIALATEYTLEQAAQSVIVAELLAPATADGDADGTLLATLSTEAGVMVDEAYLGLLAWFRDCCPDADSEEVAQAVDAIIRLVVSYALSPGAGSHRDAGNAVARVAVMLLPELGAQGPAAG